MGVTNPTHRDLKKTTTYMENMSFDEDYEVLARLPLTLNPVSGTLERPTAIQGNSSIVLSYNGSGNLTQVAKTISGTTYTKTFTWDGDRLTNISTWS